MLFLLAMPDLHDSEAKKRLLTRSKIVFYRAFDRRRKGSVSGHGAPAVSTRYRNGDRESRTFARFAFHRHAAAEQASEVFLDVKPQAEAAVRSGR
jgi:hypothetical protein